MKQKTNHQLLLQVLFFFAVWSMNAQNLTQTVKGRVVDAATEIPIKGATVQLVNSSEDIYSVSDDGGYFMLEGVPLGRQSFNCNYLGYEDFFIAEVLIGSAKEVSLTIRLTESLQTLNEVVLVAPKDNIKSNNTMATVSARSFSVEETKRFPASISDPSRMALSLPGVTNSDDSTNEIIVRGNAPNQFLWKIEGVEVPDPNHFSEEGFTAGAVSLLSTNIMGRSDFFTGAFPAEYGNATSGVFDIKIRNGNNTKREYAFQLGVLGTDIALEGPFSKNYKGSYLVNYRYSTLTLLNEVVGIIDNGIPTFQDLSFKLNFPLSDKSNISLWGIGGLSESDEIDNDEIDQGITEKEFFDSKTYMTGINFKYFISPKSTFDAILSYSGNESNYDFRKENAAFNQTERNNDALSNSALRFSMNLTNKFSPKATLKSGMIYSFLNFDVLSDSSFNEFKSVDLDESGDGSMTQFFSQMKYRFNDKLTATYGFHSTYFSINKDFVVEPRAGLNYKINKKHTINAGFGLHSRRMPMNQYFVRLPDTNGNVTTPNKDIDFMQSTHFVVGYDYKIIRNGHLKIEAYYQDINDVAISKDPNYTASFVNGELLFEELTASGKARNYGVEITLEKFFSDQYYFLTTASFYDSKYKAADGNWYDSSFNFKYTFNIVGGKEFSMGKNNNNLLGVNLKTLLNGGRRATPADLELFDQTGQEVLLQNQRNSIKLDDYFRLDASIYYRINRHKLAHIISLDIQNVTNRDNIESAVFNPDTRSLDFNYQLPLLPILNYRIEF